LDRNAKKHFSLESSNINIFKKVIIIKQAWATLRCPDYFTIQL
jgi:hypothetical protein